MEEPLQQAKNEMRKAKVAIENMKQLITFEVYQENWTIFLNSIEKLWIKAERECQPIKNKFEPWQGAYKKMRRNDPLLSYIKQARDADNHSIQELVEKISGNTTVSPATPGVPVHIKSMTKVEGKIINLEANTPFVVTVNPPKALAKAIMNSGKVYTVPRFHLGQPIKNETNPVILAELALKYHESFLNALEAKFFSTV